MFSSHVSIAVITRSTCRYSTEVFSVNRLDIFQSLTPQQHLNMHSFHVLIFVCLVDCVTFEHRIICILAMLSCVNWSWNDFGVAGVALL